MVVHILYGCIVFILNLKRFNTKIRLLGNLINRTCLLNLVFSGYGCSSSRYPFNSSGAVKDDHALIMDSLSFNTSISKLIYTYGSNLFEERVSTLFVIELQNTPSYSRIIGLMPFLSK